MRQSKEQTQENGRALLALPSRTVETELIPFGSESEKAVYEAIENRNRSRFMELKKESAKTVAGNYMELNAILVSARQACSHVSLIDFHKFHRLNQKLADEKLEAKGKKKQVPINTTTRAGVLEAAIECARHSAKSRMRLAIMQFQHGDCEMLECPVCLDPVGEAQIALPACAHPICTTCILGILDSASSSREPVGHCPTCRDIVRRSELTFLGDATEAGTYDKSEDEDADLVEKPAAVNVNGFRLKAQEVEVSVIGSTTLRAGHSTLSGHELKKRLRSDLAELSTLDEPLLKNAYSASGQVGTKVALLLQEIRSMMRKSATSKCIVFTQFLGVLDVAGAELEARNIGFVRLDGNCKQYERADALMAFDSDPSVRVFLLSMRSGAVGLNLTAADHCFLIDLAQNPAIEEQGIDRIHRIGQTKPVTVKRFVIQGTVEERLLSVRRKLGIDQSVGAQVNGVVQEDEGETRRPRKKARTSSEGDEMMDAQQQKRVEMLETLYGCKMNVHKA